MAKPRRTSPAKMEKLRNQGERRTVPESRARRERLELKSQPMEAPAVGQPISLGGSMSDRSAAARAGRQPVLESPNEHPAGKGPPMPRREAMEERARGAAMKPGAAKKPRPDADAEEE